WMIAWPILYTIVTLQTVRLVGLKVSTYLGGIKHPVFGSLLMVVVVLLAQKFLMRGASALQTSLATVMLGGAVYVGYHLAVNRSAIQELTALMKRPRAPAPIPSSQLDLVPPDDLVFALNVAPKDPAFVEVK